MKRYKFSQHEGLDNLVVSSIHLKSNPFPEDKVEKNEVFSMIFAPDPLTGRPRSDLGLYMSENTSPLVRDFVERNLRTDFSSKSVPAPEGVSDSDVAFLTRGRDETVEDYLSRTRNYINDQRSVVKSEARKAVIRKNALLRAKKSELVTE